MLHRGSAPAWSPNGRTIAFIADNDLWTMRLDGTGALRILSAKRAGSPLDRPSWRPDGTVIGVYDGGVLVVNPNGSHVQRLDLSSALDGSPFDHVDSFDWSPDGTLLALAIQHESTRIVLFSPETETADVIATNVPLNAMSWQPRCTLFGDQGANTLTGTAAPDVICALAGPDRIVGGPGLDRIFGGPGNDKIDSRDGMFDVVGCGAGRDVVIADRLDLVGVDCEAVHRR